MEKLAEPSTATTTSVRTADTMSSTHHSLPQLPPSVVCPPSVVEYPTSPCKCPEPVDGVASQLARSDSSSIAVTVPIGVTIGIAIGMFVLGATLVALLWLIYVKTDPNQKLKPEAMSEDGISSSQESGHAVTQRLMGDSREITASSLQS